MSIEDTVIAETAALQRNWPNLTAHDWRVLGSIIDAGPQGLAYAAIRADTEWYGSNNRHLPSLQRLTEAGLVEKLTIGPGRGEVFYKRTGQPLVATSSPTPAQPALTFVL